ncbi:MAG: patatin-like phospholipase family protein [Filomicrobium sp.]
MAVGRELRFSTLSRVLVVVFAAVCLGACATVTPRNGIADPHFAQMAHVAGAPGIRFWGDEVPTDVHKEIRRRLPNLPGLAQATRGARTKVEILALSGGGGDGAFGAGLLAGWTARGDRPQFEVVTGVSAGAIIAPFAFLGPSYDDELREIWTQYRTSQIITAQILPGLLGGSSLADSTPMQELIARYVDRRLMRAVAREYGKGRILLVGTTNLDAQRPVVWNMGEIARSGHKDALALFRKVILASAAIPGVFPPVEIPVRVGYKTFTEMHVDGGTTRELFVLPVDVPFRAFDAFYRRPPRRKVYIVSNMKIGAEQEVVEPKTLEIAGRSISTLIKMQSRANVYRIYRMAKDDGVDFNYISVPLNFDLKAEEFFDPEYQRALYDVGYQLGKKGNGWKKGPYHRPPT